MLHDISQRYRDRLIIGLRHVIETLQFVDQNAQLSANVHNEKRDQSECATSYGICKKPCEELQGEDYLVCRRDLTIELNEVARTGQRSHRDVHRIEHTTLRERHESAVRQSTDIHKERREDRKFPAYPCFGQHRFPIVPLDRVIPIPPHLLQARFDLSRVVHEQAVLHAAHPAIEDRRKQSDSTFKFLFLQEYSQETRHDNEHE